MKKFKVSQVKEVRYEAIIEAENASDALSRFHGRNSKITPIKVLTTHTSEEVHTIVDVIEEDLND